MDLSKYKNKMKPPSRPTKPRSPGNDGTSAQYTAYASDLAVWESELKNWRIDMKAYAEEDDRLLTIFKHDALEEVGLFTHPKADAAYEFAWRHGHSSGLYEVMHWLEDIAELLKD